MLTERFLIKTAYFSFHQDPDSVLIPFLFG